MALTNLLSISEACVGTNVWPLARQSSILKEFSCPLVQLVPERHRRRLELRALVVATDVQQTLEEEYGSRYERPDRYPRLRRRQEPFDQTGDVRGWLEKLAAVAATFAPSAAPNAETKDQALNDNFPGFPKDVIERQQLLVRQGHLDEVLLIVRSCLAGAASTSAASGPALGFSPAEGVCWGGMDHSDMLEACADAGNVELGFEYASLFPPEIGSYTFLAAAFARRSNPEVAGLAARTAERRGALHDPVLLLVCLASTAKTGNVEAAKRDFEKMVLEGLLRQGASFEDVRKACMGTH